MATTIAPPLTSGRTKRSWKLRRLDSKLQKVTRKRDLRAEHDQVKRQITGLMYEKYGKLRYLVLVRPAALVFKGLLALICLYVGKLAVTGFYDLFWEGNTRLNYAGGILLAAAFVLSAVMGIRSRFVNRTAVRTAYVASLLMALLGGAALVAYTREGVTTNTELWHWLVTSDGFRHLLLRATPEGLIGGIFLGFITWNPLKYHPIPWFNPLLRRFYPTLDQSVEEERPIRAWMVWVAPIVVLVAAAEVAGVGYWVTTLFQHHAAGVHHGVHSAVPWHVDANLTPSGTSTVDNAKNSVFAGIGGWFVGYGAAHWWGRPAVYGIVNRAHELLVQLRIIKKEGELVKVVSAFQPLGYQMRAVMEHNEEVNVKEEVFDLGPDVVALFRYGIYVLLGLAAYGFLYVYYLANRH